MLLEGRAIGKDASWTHGLNEDIIWHILVREWINLHLAVCNAPRNSLVMNVGRGTCLLSAKIRLHRKVPVTTDTHTQKQKNKKMDMVSKRERRPDKVASRGAFS